MTSNQNDLRLCLFDYQTEAIKLLKKTVNGILGTGPKYKGIMGEVINWSLNTAFGRELLNYTSVIKQTYGRLNTTSGLYEEDSCLYSMQTNESDAAIIYVQSPVVAKGLRQHSPYFEDYVEILSKWNNTDNAEIRDILHSFREAFDTNIWIVLFVFTFIFIILLKVEIAVANKGIKWARMQRAQRMFSSNFPKATSKKTPTSALTRGAQKLSRVKNRSAVNLVTNYIDLNRLYPLKDSAIYDVLTHLFQVESIDYEVVSMRLASLFMTILSFYILTYFSNLMSTEMVVVEQPALIRSYKDLLARNKVHMMFLDFQDDYMDFEFAPEGSVRRRLWLKSLRTVQNRRESMFVKMDSSQFLRVASRVRKIATEGNEVVAMFSKIVSPAARATMCLLKTAIAFRNRNDDVNFKTLASVFIKTSKDPNVRISLASGVFRKEFDCALAKRIDRRFTQSFDMGIPVFIFEKLLTKPAFEQMAITTPREGDEFRKCMTDNVQENLKKIQLTALKPVQFFHLFIVLFCIPVVAFWVLCYETWL